MDLRHTKRGGVRLTSTTYPQMRYVDQIPKSIKGTVGGIISKKDEKEPKLTVGEGKHELSQDAWLSQRPKTNEQRGEK